MQTLLNRTFTKILNSTFSETYKFSFTSVRNSKRSKLKLLTTRLFDSLFVFFLFPYFCFGCNRETSGDVRRDWTDFQTWKDVCYASNFMQFTESWSPICQILLPSSRVADPDPTWIRIQSGQWIRIQSGQLIRIRIQEWPTKVETNKEISYFEVLDVVFWELKASSVTWTFFMVA